MAGDVKVEVVTGAISTSSTGTADFTVSGFGTVLACKIVLSHDQADDASIQANYRGSIGLSDFTDHFCVSHQDDDASANVDSDKYGASAKAYLLMRGDGAVVVDGTASAITDGVRLTNTTNGGGTAQIAQVTLYGGADLQISLDKVTTPNSDGGTVVVTTNIDQDIIIVIGQKNVAEDTRVNNVQHSYGLGHIDTSDHATFVNRCIGWSSDHAETAGSPGAIIQNDQVATFLTAAGVEDWGLELTAATTTAYTLTERVTGSASGVGNEVYVLALDLDDRKSKIGSVDSPTSGATWTPSVSLGFTPQFVELGLTQLAAEGAVETDGDAGSIGFSNNAGSGSEACTSWYNEDAAATTNTASLFRSRAIDFRSDDQATVIQDHSHSSFNDGDWTYTINDENETAARKWLYGAIEVAAVAGGANPKGPLGMPLHGPFGGPV